MEKLDRIMQDVCVMGGKAAIHGLGVPDGTDSAALRKAGAMVDEMLAAHGVDVEEVVQEFKALRKKSRAKVV